MNKKQLKQFDKYFGNIYFGDVPFREMREDIKQFISNLLKEERKEHFSSSKEIIKVCKELEYSDGCSGQSRDCGSFKYNQALQDIIKSLK